MKALAAAVVALVAAVSAQADTPPPVTEIGDQRLPVAAAELPVFVSRDWSRPLPDVRRVVVIVHGYERNAGDYLRHVAGMKPAADTLIVAPQFLAPGDIAGHDLPAATLRWGQDAWSSGLPALGPVPESSFEIIDVLLARFGERGRFPNLTGIVLAGFSAGGQFVQRYVAAGKGEEAIGRDGVALRYVVGSPSSFAYFGDARPGPDGTIAAFADAAACPQYNNWKYGFAGKLPAYVAAALAPGVPLIERRYAARDVTYLVGGADDNPNHKFLDKSCGAEAQGSTRLARLQDFYAVMRRRDGAALHQTLHIIPGAAHNAAKVLGSPCGRVALFGVMENCQ
ncbi:MAG TPA: hypothetical protein VGG57_04380 [Stellaceae bacterium]|jgi:hypothetical protein